MKKIPNEERTLRMISEFEGGPSHIYLGTRPSDHGDEGKRIALYAYRFQPAVHRMLSELKLILTLEAISWEKKSLFNPCEECDECEADTCFRPIEDVGTKGSGMQIVETLEGWFIDLGKCKPLIIERPIVNVFATEMEKQLRANEYKGGWNSSSSTFLIDNLLSNAGKLRGAINRKDPQEVIIRRAANIANFAMMLAENEGKLK